MTPSSKEIYTLEGEPLESEFVSANKNAFKLQENGKQRFKEQRRKFKQYLTRNGILLSVARVTEKDYVGADKFFRLLKTYLSDAKEVWMCVGEMGHRMMERPEVVEGLRRAIDNKAKIKIVRGPRVDPETHTVFEMAKRGGLNIYALERYPADHFTVMRMNDGNIVLFDESSHPEVMRGLDQEGNRVEIFRGVFRVFYALPKPGYLGAVRLASAKRRVNSGVLNLEKPEIQLGRGYNINYVFFSLKWFYLPLTFFIQPLAIFLVTAQIRIRRFISNLPHRVKPKGGSESSAMYTKIENITIIGTMLVVLIILDGIMLEGILKIPISNVQIHLLGAIASACLGGVLGFLLIKTD